MKVKELKEFLEKFKDDNANVHVCDSDGAEVNVIKVYETQGNGLGFEIRHEFPDAWFDKRGCEVRYIRGKAVGADTKMTEADIFLSPAKEGVRMFIYNGFALRAADGEKVLEYPKLEDLTDEQLEAVDAYVGGRISDSGTLLCEDVALALGKQINKTQADHYTTCMVETVQNITLVAWPIVYGDKNPYDLDSTEVLIEFREWGDEFERWWLGLDEVSRDKLDYLAEVEAFAERKASEYIKNFKQ